MTGTGESGADARTTGGTGTESSRSIGSPRRQIQEVPESTEPAPTNIMIVVTSGVRLCQPLTQGHQTLDRFVFT